MFQYLNHEFCLREQCLKLKLRHLYHVQIYSGAAGGAGQQCVSNRRKHAVPWDEGASGEGAAGYEAFSVTF